MKLNLTDASKLLLEGSIALADLENNGISVDIEYLSRTINKLDRKVTRLSKSLRDSEVYDVWRKRFGANTSLSSRPQLCEVLFDSLRMKYDENRFPKTKTGRYSSTEEVIASVDDPFCSEWLEMTKIGNLKTKMQSLQNETVDRRLHVDVKLHSAKSFRSSTGKEEESQGKSFNFQAVPHRDEKLSKTIRRCFIPSEGNVLTEVDMAAHEWRISAARWPDQEMRRYVQDNRDIHRELAARMFLCKPEQVSGPMRHLGKNGFVFPVLYGSYYVAVAARVWLVVASTKLKDSETTVYEHLKSKGIRTRNDFEDHVKKVEDWFRKKFAGFAKESEKEWQHYLKRGWFDLVTGFRLSGAYSRNQVLNIEIQGPAFHCLLKGGITEATRRLRKYKMKTKLVGTIHDSVEADGPEKEVSPFLSMFREVMCDWLPNQWGWICVPLGVEAKVSPRNWYEQITYTEQNGTWKPQ